MLLFVFVGSLWVNVLMVVNENDLVVVIFIMLFNWLLLIGVSVVFNMLNFKLILLIDVGVYVCNVFILYVFLLMCYLFLWYGV